MERSPTTAEIHSLFANGNPDEVWAKAFDVLQRIDPAHDFAQAHTVFSDVMRLFHGEYPGYCAVKTLYHNLPHTLDVFLCAVRLAHGVHLSGSPLSNDEITRIMIAALMHDIGYAQRLDEDTGTGAQFTRNHVSRGIEFMRGYMVEHGFPAVWAASLEAMMLCTDHIRELRTIDFPDERTRLIGKIVATADLVGQMSDRTYPEKLMFLFLEFKEADLGNYQCILDLLRTSKGFYEFTRQERLDGELEQLYTKLTFHFKECLGVARNFYMESMERNVEYVARAAGLDEAGCLSMLKRGGIAEKVQTLIAPDKTS